MCAVRAYCERLMIPTAKTREEGGGRGGRGGSGEGDGGKLGGGEKGEEVEEEVEVAALPRMIPRGWCG